MIDNEYSSHKIFLHADKVGEYASGKDIYPICYEVNLTNKCNYNCEWCSERSYRDLHKDDMIDTNVMIDAIRAMSRNGVRSIVFEGGGEPTLHPDLIRFAVEAFDKKIDVGLITNGTSLYDSHIISNLKYFKFVRVSFDAGTEEVYSRVHGCDYQLFSFVIMQVEDLIKKKIDDNLDTIIGVSFIITEETLETLVEFVRIFSSIGVDYVQVKPLISDNRIKYVLYTKDTVERCKFLFESEKFKILSVRFGPDTCVVEKNYKYCYAHRFIGAISANGRVQLCCNLKHYNNDQFNFGRLSEGVGLDSIFRGSTRRDLVDWIESDSTFIKDYCGQCRMDSINRFFNMYKRRSDNTLVNFL